MALNQEQFKALLDHLLTREEQLVAKLAGLDTKRGKHQEESDKIRDQRLEQFEERREGFYYKRNLVGELKARIVPCDGSSPAQENGSRRLICQSP